MNQNEILSRSSTQTQSDLSDYQNYSRPLTARLLEAMQLSKNFIDGEGDYLYYEKDGKKQKVLDLTGGYGANLLGHRNPQVLNVVRNWLENGIPNLLQGSIRNTSGLLSKKISDILSRETGEGPWVTTLSNSGTEAVEAAIKHCLLRHKHKLITLNQDLEKENNQALAQIKQLDAKSQIKITVDLRKTLIWKIASLQMSESRKDYLLHQLANCHDIDSIISLVREINEKQIAQRPKLVAVEKGYHGKSMGSLAITSNEGFRQDFYLGNDQNHHTLFISPYSDLLTIENKFKELREDLIYLTETREGYTWGNQKFTLVAGAFAEPIQGEAGVIPLSDSFLAYLKKFSLQEDFLLVFDEIQAGMFRTGSMSSGHQSHITADIYTFSKSLGGGVAKIAAMTINRRKYIDDFGFLHTSTFCEDDFSSLVALEVLSILDQSSLVSEGMNNAQYLKLRLEWLREQFPQIIKEIRGKGFLLAIEFSDEVFSDLGFEFKAICDARMQGYLIASCLLNHENIRMNPSLSNNLTLRIQPSLYFDMIHTEALICGLTNLCDSIMARNVEYLLSSIYPHETIKNRTTKSINPVTDLGKRPLSVFLCHMIDANHIRSVTASLKNLTDRKLVEKLELTKDLAEFSIYHYQTITNKDGKEMDIIMLGVPLTSEELKRTFLSRNRYQVVQKVQNAIDYAKELGATTVGLGQFSSIVSGNGLYLNPRGMNLTTGNAYTISLTVQSALHSAREKNIEINKSHVALIGAAGNIMSVATSIMADHVGKVTLIHHTPIEASAKYQEAVRRILKEIIQSNSSNELVRLIKAHYTKQMNLLDFLSLPQIKAVFETTSDLNKVKEADIVLCGASSSNGFLDLDLFRTNAVIVDIAVPASIKKEVVERMKTERPDLVYHLGGIAKIPNQQSIDLYLFPLQKEQSFACMAETFSIGFSGKKNILHVGDLTKSMVMSVTHLAEEAGFVLGNIKKSNSL